MVDVTDAAGVVSRALELTPASSQYSEQAYPAFVLGRRTFDTYHSRLLQPGDRLEIPTTTGFQLPY